MKISFTIYLDDGVSTGHKLVNIPMVIADGFYEVLVKENLAIPMRGFEIACDMDKERSPKKPEGVAYQWLKTFIKESRETINAEKNPNKPKT